jgi:hypothetical protein
MLSVVIASTGAAPALVATFASLHEAATDGFVREVIVANATPNGAIRAAADDAGARVVEGPDAFGAACGAARQPWLLLLKAGARLAVGWEPHAWRHLNDHQDQAGWFRLSLAGSGLGVRAEEARAALEARILGRPRAEHGLLLPRRLYDVCIERGARAELPLRPGRGALRPVGASLLA